MKLMRRGLGQAIRIQPDFELDPATPVGELFVNGAIQIVVMGAEEEVATLAVHGDRRFLVVEDERFCCGAAVGEG